MLNKRNFSFTLIARGYKIKKMSNLTRCKKKNKSKFVLLNVCKVANKKSQNLRPNTPSAHSKIVKKTVHSAIYYYLAR